MIRIAAVKQPIVIVTVVFSILPIDAQAENIEYLGTKRKFWYWRDNVRYLFKAEERGTGEDWAEKVVCELARLLRLPHVEYHLALQQDGNVPGVICENFTPRPLSLVMGNQLLVQRDADYPAKLQKKFGVRKYTVDAVADVMRVLGPPAQRWMRHTPAHRHTAMGVFAGYMLLDAWVANQDRHHQNWGAILEDGKLHLAPTYDHGSSLARNLLDDERHARLTTKDHNYTVARFAARARSEFYPNEGIQTLSMIEVFRRFAALVPDEAEVWLTQLRAITTETIDAVLGEVPPERMSPITRRFTLDLLTINQRRLLGGDVR